MSHDCSEKVKCKEDCNNNGVCHNNGRCGCYPGWRGVVCRTLIPCPRNCTDSNSGVCQPDSTCKCKPGFTGKDCSALTIIGNSTATNSDPFKALTALTAKKIKSDSNKLKEDVKDKKKGGKKHKKILCPNGCSGHGTCNFSTGKCACENNFSGDDCNIKMRKADVLKRQAKDGGDEDNNNSSDDDNKNTKSSGANSSKTDAKNATDSSSADEDSSSSSSSDKDAGKTSKDKDAGKTNKESTETAATTNANDASNSDSSASEAAATEKQKLEIKNLKLYKMGDSGEIYYQTTDCMNNCTKRGLCLNSTCFCEQGYSSDDCAMTYKQYLEQGIKFSDVSGLLIGAFAFSLIGTIVVMMIKKANKVTNDHIEFE
jgi:hypothetical protein